MKRRQLHLEWGAEAITRHPADLYVIVDFHCPPLL